MTFIPLLSETLLVWLFAASLWVSLRVLRYPDLAVEQTAVLVAALWIGAGTTPADPVVRGSWILAACLLLSATAAVLRVVFQVNGVLTALCLAYAMYSVSLTAMGGPNVAWPNHPVPPDNQTLLWRIGGVLAVGTLVTALLRSAFGTELLAASSNRDLYIRLRSRNRLLLMQTLGHLVAQLPMVTFAIASVARAGFVDVGSTYGRLLQALFVVLTTVMLYPRCRFEAAGPLMLLPTTVIVLLGRLLLELGVPSTAFSGIIAAALVAFLLLLRQGTRGFRVEEALRA